MTRGAQDAAQAPAEGIFVVAEENLSHGVGPEQRAGSNPPKVSHVPVDPCQLFLFLISNMAYS
jgi:hypothetical protein